MTLRDDLLPVFGDARALIDDFGLRTTRVIIRTRTWTGGPDGKQVGLGTYTDSDLEILPRPRVRTNREGELVVDRITPAYAGGGYTLAQLNPLPNLTDGQEVKYILIGPNGTKQFCGVEVESRKNFGYSIRMMDLDRAVPD